MPTLKTDANPRRRIWSELLPAAELGSPATISLLERFSLEPIVAVAPQSETHAMAEALARLAKRGIRVGLWPLLSDEQGYWPSETNAQAFCERVDQVLAFAKSAGARVETIAIDLEPPLETTRQLMAGTRSRIGLLREGLRSRNEPERREERAAAIEHLTTLARGLRDRGIETIAATLPPVVLDLISDTRLWQEVFRTPISKPDWAVVSPMMYTSALAPMIPSRSIQGARTLLYEAGRALARGRYNVCLSLGLIATGKLGDEPTFGSPTDLQRDVEAALATGIDDLALFSLEGVLERGDPESWIVPYTQASAVEPRGARYRARSMVIRAIAWMAMRLAGSKMTR